MSGFAQGEKCSLPKAMMPAMKRPQALKGSHLQNLQVSTNPNPPSVPWIVLGSLYYASEDQLKVSKPLIRETHAYSIIGKSLYTTRRQITHISIEDNSSNILCHCRCRPPTRTASKSGEPCQETRHIRALCLQRDCCADGNRGLLF